MPNQPTPWIDTKIKELEKKEDNWKEKLAEQYGRRQMAALRNDATGYYSADQWLRIIASEHWHEIIIALRDRKEKTDA